MFLQHSYSVLVLLAVTITELELLVVGSARTFGAPARIVLTSSIKNSQVNSCVNKEDIVDRYILELVTSFHF